MAKPTSGDATLADTATLLGDQGATLSTANASVAISTALNCPDVVVTKTAPKDTIDAGDTASFTITVTNNGPGIAKNVTLNDPLPADIAWQDDSADCSITNGTLSCQFGDLDPEESRTVHVSGTTDAQDCGVLLNTATVSASNEPQEKPGNNTDSADITVLCPSPQHHEDRRRSVRERGRHGRLHDHRDEQRPRHGQERGRERHAAHGTVASSWSIDGGTGAQNCSITNGVLTCTFPSIAAGASVTVHLTSPTTAATWARS